MVILLCTICLTLFTVFLCASLFVFFFSLFSFFPQLDVLSLFFFFSSRRRHTRLVSDWSSDVCSSDLGDLVRGPLPGGAADRALGGALRPARRGGRRGRGGAAAAGAGARRRVARLPAGAERDLARSEERRVGKEGSYGWVAGQEQMQYQ